MHLILDLFDCDPEALEVKDLDELDDWPDELTLLVDNPAGTTAWADCFSLDDFDAATVVSRAIAALGAGSAEYQVIQRGRGYRRAPRPEDIPVVPWLKTGPPVPEAEPK